jgi:hypothetical protein
MCWVLTLKPVDSMPSKKKYTKYGTSKIPYTPRKTSSSTYTKKNIRIQMECISFVIEGFGKNSMYDQPFN